MATTVKSNADGSVDITCGDCGGSTYRMTKVGGGRLSIASALQQHCGVSHPAVEQEVL